MALNHTHVIYDNYVLANEIEDQFNSMVDLLRFVKVDRSLVGTAGDLVESRFKREFDVKDSATFMPAGQGGFLDMFDSVLFIPAMAYPILVRFNTTL